MRQSDEFAWHEADIWGAGRIHRLKYKLVPNVLWKTGTRDTPLRLIIVAPLGYRRTPKSKKLYRQPAYLLTTDLVTPVEVLIQAYFDRWEIEVNHCDEKSMFGVGEAQVWSKQAAPRAAVSCGGIAGVAADTKTQDPPKMPEDPCPAGVGGLFTCEKLQTKGGASHTAGAFHLMSRALSASRDQLSTPSHLMPKQIPIPYRDACDGTTPTRPAAHAHRPCGSHPG